MSLVLGIETSTAVSSVALARNDRVLGARTTLQGRGHVEFLMPSILDLMAEHGCSMREPTAVAVGIGPGLFTGLRVGVATAKTIAQMLQVGLVGVSSLDNLALQQRRDDRLIVACIDARRAEVFVAHYRDGKRIGEPANLAPADVVATIDEPALFVGDGAVAYADVFSTVGEVRAAHPDAETLVRMARDATPVDPALVEPSYVRRSEAEIKWEGRGVMPQRPGRVKIAGQR